MKNLILTTITTAAGFAMGCAGMIAFIMHDVGDHPGAYMDLLERQLDRERDRRTQNEGNI